MTSAGPAPAWRKRCRSSAAAGREERALRLLRGCVRVVGVEGDVLVLERVVPGTALVDAGLDDDAMTCVLGTALLGMQVPDPGADLPSVEEECRSLTGDAASVLRELLADAPAPVVLHGDLHHGNLLRGPDGWVGVDPHGVAGDPGYDVGPLLLNALAPDVGRQAHRRLDLLADVLGQDRARLQAWGWVRACLSRAWSAQDGTPPLPGVEQVEQALRPR